MIRDRFGDVPKKSIGLHPRMDSSSSSPSTRSSARRPTTLTTLSTPTTGTPATTSPSSPTPTWGSTESSDRQAQLCRWVFHPFTIFHYIMRLRQLQVLDIVEFPGPPKLNQTLWPDHCVQGSWGAQLHEDLKVRYSRTKDYARARPIEKKNPKHQNQMFDFSKINYSAKTNTKPIQTDTMNVCQTCSFLPK